MPRSSYTQPGFLGGEWSPLAQARFDHPFYRQAMNVNLNAIIAEEGAWIRRSGTQTIGPTYLRGAAKLLPFQSTAANPYLMEFTADKLRIWYSTGPVCTNDRQVITASSSSGGILTLTTTTNHGWAVGDHLILFIPSTLNQADTGYLRGRHLQILTQNGTTGLTAGDDMGLQLPDDIAANGLNTATAIRIKRFDTTGITAAMLPNVRAIQAQTQSVILSGVAPKLLTVTTDIASGSDSDPVMSFAAATFVDGPYLDPQSDTGTVSAYSGTITFTPASSTFVAADVGRLIRLFSQPAAWASGTTYSVGDKVTDTAGAWWVCVYGGVSGVIPGTTKLVGSIPYVVWMPAPGSGSWAWGTISAQAGTSCTVVLTTTLQSANGATVSSWQLGVYKTGQYPTCGVYHEGRLWLGGAVRNRFDASMSNALLTFSPTDTYGNVLDNSAISVTLNFDDLADVFWMIPDAQGILVGTNGGEVLISASQLNDPITPTSIQANRITKYMSEFVEPRRTGLAIVFAQRYQQRIIEYLADGFTSGQFRGRHINEFAKHLSASGVKELAYQEEKAPVLWSLMNDGSLAGCTYRRVNRFIDQPPKVEAWQEFELGDLSTVNSMCVLPGIDTLSDNLYLNVLDANSEYWIDMLRPIFEDA